MYIEFSSNFANSISRLNPNDVMDLFQRAYFASKDGCHIISCESRQTASDIIQYIHRKNNSLLESFFHELSEQIVEIQGLKSHFLIYMTIVAKNTTNLKISPINKVEIGLDVAKSPDFWKEIYFLVEYSRDAILYEWIAKYIKEQNRNLKKIELKFHIMNGGGGTTHREMTRLNNGNRMILCFLDSDKNDPNQNEYGATAKNFSDNDRTAVSDYYIMKAHELENLFFTHSCTLNLYEKGDGVQKKKIQRKKIFEEVDRKISTIESRCNDFRLYFDVKLGYRKKDIVGIDYLKNALGETSFCAREKKECDKKCKRCDEDIIKGYGEDFLQLIKNKYTANIRDLFRDAQSLNELQKKEWETIGKKMLSWCCSYKCNSRGI